MFKLLTNAMIGKVRLKNRIIFPSMCLYFSDDEGNVTEKLSVFFENRARAGVGAFIIGANPHGANKLNRPSLADDSRIEQWQRFNNALHGYDARVFCQLHPSGLQFGRTGFSKSPLDMATEDVETLIESYAQGALRARKAGFDGVEIHGAHGHEVALFLSMLLNKRTDKFGGDLEGHAAIVTEMIKKIKDYAGQDYPVILRISGEERLSGGRKIEGTVELCRLVEAAGADAIHISVGMPDSEEWECPSSEVPQGHLAWMGEVLKRHLKIPVIVVGRIVDWKVAEDIVASDKADFLAVGRALLAEPNWMQSIGNNEAGLVHLCIGCNQGCRTKRAKESSPTGCLQNPLLGLEEKIQITKDSKVKNVCVVGAGVSGLEAAEVMYLRGHQVTIFERDKEIGGLFRYASMPPGKKDYLSLLRYYQKNLAERGVRFVFDYNVDQLPDGFDIYLIASGGKEIIPPLNAGGVKLQRAVDLLAEGNPQDDTYVVVGDGLVGYETADFLISFGKKVIMVGDSPEDPIARLGIARWHFMNERFKHGDIRIIQHSLITSIVPHSFSITSEDGKSTEVKGDYSFVLACGYKANDELYNKVKDSKKEIYLIGSAKNCGDAMDSIHDAFFTAMGIAIC